MKPFNLEEFKAGKKAITASGHTVKFLAHEPGFCVDERVLAKMVGSVSVSRYREDGRHFECNKYNLVGMAPETLTFYVNIYKDAKGAKVGNIYDDEDYAKSVSNNLALAVAKPIQIQL